MDTALIPLTQGKFAIVDACDYEWLNQWNWYAHKRKRSFGYYWCVYRRGPRPEKAMITMQGEVAKRAALPESYIYDHKNRNALDNRRENLRPCTQSQNRSNSTKRSGTSSKYKGVCWCKRSKKWISTITVNYKHKTLGLFADERDAHLAYAAAAYKHFGEFAAP